MPQSPFFPDSSSSTFFSRMSLRNKGSRHPSFTILIISLLSAMNLLHTTSTNRVNPIVTTKYRYTQYVTFVPSLSGEKSQNVVLKKVATNVPGRKMRVIAVMSRISAPYRWFSWLSVKVKTRNQYAVYVQVMCHCHTSLLEIRVYL